MEDGNKLEDGEIDESSDVGTHLKNGVMLNHESFQESNSKNLNEVGKRKSLLQPDISNVTDSNEKEENEALLETGVNNAPNSLKSSNEEEKEKVLLDSEMSNRGVTFEIDKGVLSATAEMIQKCLELKDPIVTDGNTINETDKIYNAHAQHEVKQERSEKTNHSLDSFLKQRNMALNISNVLTLQDLSKEKLEKQDMLNCGMKECTTAGTDMDIVPTAEVVIEQQLEKNEDILNANIHNTVAPSITVYSPSLSQLTGQKIEKKDEVLDSSKPSTPELDDIDVLLARHELIRQQLEKNDKSLHASLQSSRTSSEVGNSDLLLTSRKLSEQPVEKKSKVLSPGQSNESTSFEVDDIDVLLCRHELIRQQLSLVHSDDDLKNESDIFEKGGRKKRKGKKRRKSKPIVGTDQFSSRGYRNSVSSSISSVTNNNERMDGSLRKSRYMADKIDDVIDEELLTLRKEALTHSSKKYEKDYDGLSSKLPPKKPPKKIKIKKSNKPSFDIDSTLKLPKLSVKKSNIKSNLQVWKPTQREILKHVTFANSRSLCSLSKSSFGHGKNQDEKTSHKSNIVLGKPALNRQKKKRTWKYTQSNQISKTTNVKGHLSYSEQQEREVKILQKQHEEMAFDNYSNIPMEIDEDEVPVNADEIIAPLPLIEMPEVRPPLPPGDDFKPVQDQAALCMTRTNVAWMPGFVETLDIDVNALSPKVEISDGVVSPKVDKEEPNSDSVKTQELNENDDDADVWALRAQALKSLACKRAVRAKELNKNKKMKSSNENTIVTKEDVLKVENIPSPEMRSPVIPSPLRHVDVVSMKKKALYNNKKQPPPPKHPRVIIQLRKEDFESESDDDEPGYSNERQAKLKVITRKRKSVHDETLLKDLQGYIKRCRLRMKKNSSSIVKDQLIYKKLQNEISKQKILHEEQKEYVKKLQEELQLALKQKTATCKIHNKLHQKIKNIKDQLMEKIQVRNTTDERILRAKTIVSVNRVQGNLKGNINHRLKFQISKLLESLRESYQALLNAEKSYDVSSNVDIISKSSVNNPSETENEHDGASNKNNQGSARKTTDFCLMVGAPKELEKVESSKQINAVVEIDDSPVEEVINNDGKFTEHEASSKDLGASITSLVELKKFFTTMNKPSETSYITYTLSELLQGLGDAESLKVIQIQTKDNYIASQNVELSATVSDNLSFKYKSPLSCFKSYRLSPKFALSSLLSIRSPTFSNEIQPHMTICHYDLLGTCNDSNCTRTHLDEKCVISTHALVNDLLAYQLNNIGCKSMDEATKQRHLNLYTNQFMKKYGGKISLDKSTTLLSNQLKEFCLSKKRELVDNVILDERGWFYQDKYLLNDEIEEYHVDHYTSNYDNYVYFLNQKMKTINDCMNSTNENQEIRYFSKKYSSIELLKERLGENPSDVKLWLSLVQHILNSDKSSNKSGKKCYKKLSSTVREYALSVLSQALEENTCSEELWVKYLKLFSMDHSTEELRELCYQAVMYAANYDVWWTCLSLEITLIGKQEICTEMIKFIKESKETADKISHYLTETILYATQLLSCCEKFNDCINYLKVALGITILSDNDKEHMANAPMVNICKSLNRRDKSLLWLCLIAVHTFKNLPKCIFSIEESGPGRLVNKETFLLDWQNGSWNSSEDDIRLLFKDALCINGDRSVSVLKDLMILYENVVAFELSLGNIESAISILRGLVSEFPSFVDGWRLLLLLYIQFFPMEDVISVGEEGINNCEADAKLVYFFSKELLKNNLAHLALENLKKCIHTYFKNDDNDIRNSSIVEMYKRMIKVCAPSSPVTSQIPELKKSEDGVIYYCLCYCLLTEEHLQVSTAVCRINTSESFEYVIHQYHSPENMKTLWIAYIEYKAHFLSKMSVISTEEYQSFIDLLFQGLVSVSAIGVVKENPNLYWRDYEFHNKVVDMCLAIIPTQEHSKVYQKLINFMPDNIPLALRICNHEFEGGNYEQARIICSSLLSEFPNCLPLWEMAIRVELKCGNIKEARWLLKEATKALPFCLHLWKELVKFEVLYSTDFDMVKVKFEEITNQASINGIGVQEILPKLA